MLGLIVGLAGVAFALTPMGMDLDRDIGLRSLFWMRGPVQPPPDVLIVSMNKRSADLLNLNPQPGAWPRSVHAELLTALDKAGAAVIVFDIFFRGPRSANGDAALKRAIARSQRSILIQFIEQDTIFLDDGRAAKAAVTEALISPFVQFSSQATGLGPFPLPKVPARVDQFWTFKPGAGNVPTLPVVALQIPALQTTDKFAGVMRLLSPTAQQLFTNYRRSPRHPADLRLLMVGLRHEFAKNPGALQHLAEKISPTTGLQSRALKALARTYGGPNSHFLNYYGPPGTIRTIPYHELVRRENSPGPGPTYDVRDKVVFVGLSEFSKVEAKEGFYTVYSRDDGIDLSGVEILATAFSNLLTDSSIRQLGGFPAFGLVFAFGVLVTFLACLTTGARAVATGVLLGAILLVVSHVAFARYNLWLPITTPLLLELPAGLIVGIFSQYLHAKSGLMSFLPPEIAKRVIIGTNPGKMMKRQFGICLFADIKGYTERSENFPPEDLHDYQNQYLEIVDPEFQKNGGTIRQRTGDGAICTWELHAGNEKDVTRRACIAAIDVRREVHEFNNEIDRKLPFPTRIGLHAGPYSIGPVGGSYYEHTVIGDTVNTASRIEDLNKLLDTEILASDTISWDLEDILMRPVGWFRFRGKKEPLPIAEVIGRRDQCSVDEHEKCDRFADALDSFEKENWSDAAMKFGEILAKFPNDGPTRFYLEKCLRYQQKPPPAGFVPVIDLDDE